MAYDNPQTIRYDLATMNFGAAAGPTTRAIKGPAGKTGRITNMGVDVTTSTVFPTTTGSVQVGLTGTLNAYASLVIPTASAASTTVSSATAATATIPADTQVLITLTEGTGGVGLAGAGFPFVEIDWS